MKQYLGLILALLVTACAAPSTRSPSDGEDVGRAAFNAALSSCKNQGYVERSAEWEWCVRSTSKKMVDDYYGALKLRMPRSVTCREGLPGTTTCTEDQ